MTKTLIQLQITVLTYASIGFLLFKVGFINETNKKFLSDLTLNVLLPISVFVSSMNNISFEILKNGFTMLVVCAFFEIAIFLVIKIFNPKWLSKKEKCVFNYSLYVSNGGFFGHPVIEGMFGELGGVYCNIFLIPMRIVAYSAGESVFNPDKKKTLKEVIIAVLKNKIIIAMVLALLLVTLNITIPTPIMTALSNVGKACSPMALITIGTILAEKIEISWKMMGKITFIAFVRLLAIPFVGLVACYILKLDITTTAIIVLLLGMPVGNTCAQYALKYDVERGFATATVFVTTIISTMTLVMWMRIVEALF